MANMQKKQWVVVKATARGFYRGQRFRPGDTLRILKGEALQPWMDDGGEASQATKGVQVTPEPSTLKEHAAKRAPKKQTTFKESAPKAAAGATQ